MIRYRKDQEPIMEYTSGKMGVQAVPGAGKTFIITHLVTRLLENMKEEDDSSKILVLTYMNSAANNFKARIRNLVRDKGISKSRFEVMTIHSLAMKIIRENYSTGFVDEDFIIVDDYKKNYILERAVDIYRSEPSNEDTLLRFLDKSSRSNPDTVDRWMEDFYQLAGNSIRLLKFANISYIDLEQEIYKGHKGIMNLISPIYSAYQKMLNSQSAMDYDDILMKAYSILYENEEIAEKYRKRYKYIFEDECQDSNLIQEKIIDIISRGNLVRVGDVNQSITSTFTGSDASRFDSFCRNASFSYEMDMAARSSRDIIDLANHLVDEVNSDKSAAYYGALKRIHIREVEKNAGYRENPVPERYYISGSRTSSFENEMNMIAKVIERYKSINPEYSIGILGFSNADVNTVSDFLLKKNIHHTKLGIDSGERKKLLYDIRNSIEYVLDPGNNRKFFDFILGCFLERETDMRLSEEEIRYLEKRFMKVDLEKLAYDDEYRNSFIDLVLSIKFDEMSSEYMKSALEKSFDRAFKVYEMYTLNVVSFIESVTGIMEMSAKEMSFLSYILYYADLLMRFENAGYERISTAFDKRNNSVFDTVVSNIFDSGESEVLPGSITLSTLHKAKGMEWDAVIIFGMNSLNFPSSLGDYFRAEKKYLRNGYRYPEAYVNMEIDYLCGKTGRNLEDYEYDLKKEIIFERVRLLYVGITRAKKSLLLMNSEKKFNEYTKKMVKRKDSLFFVKLLKYINIRKN